MAFANPIVITLNAVPYNLVRINQDQYGSEYLYRGTLFELRAKIRHQKEGVQTSGKQFDRHNVELTQKVYATVSATEIVRQAYIVLRNDYADVAAEAAYLDAALIDFVDGAGVVADLIAWAN